MPGYRDSVIRLIGLAVLGWSEVHREHKGERVGIGGEAAIDMPGTIVL